MLWMLSLCIMHSCMRPICNAIQPREITVRFAAMEIFFESLLFIFFPFQPRHQFAFGLCVFHFHFFIFFYFLSFNRMGNSNSTKISTIFFYIHKLKLILFVCVSFDFPLFKNCAWLTFPLAGLFSVCFSFSIGWRETWQRYDKEQKMKMQFSWWVFNILKRHKLYLFAIHKCFCFSTFDFSFLSAYFFYTFYLHVVSIFHNTTAIKKSITDRRSAEKKKKKSSERTTLRSMQVAKHQAESIKLWADKERQQN